MGKVEYKCHNMMFMTCICTMNNNIFLLYLYSGNFLHTLFQQSALPFKIQYTPKVYWKM